MLWIGGKTFIYISGDFTACINLSKLQVECMDKSYSFVDEGFIQAIQYMGTAGA